MPGSQKLTPSSSAKETAGIAIATLSASAALAANERRIDPPGLLPNVIKFIIVAPTCTTQDTNVVSEVELNRLLFGAA